MDRDGAGDDGLTNPPDGGDWRTGDALAVTPPDRLLVDGDPDARRTKRLEPAMVRSNPMIAAHWRRRMSEAYGHRRAVSRGEFRSRVTVRPRAVAAHLCNRPLIDGSPLFFELFRDTVD